MTTTKTTKLARIFGLMLAAQLLLAVPAHAHAAYESSDPADKSTVSSPPSRVNVEFTEPVVQESYLEVYDPCGVRVDNRDSLVAGDRITISMSADKQGSYTVVFAVVSSLDGHPTNGDFSFSSSGGSPCSEPEGEEEEDPAPSGNDGSKDVGAASDDGGSGTMSSGASPENRNDGAAQRDRARSSGGSQDRGSENKGRKTTGSSPRGVKTLAGGTSESSGPPADLAEGITLGAVIVALLTVVVIGGAGGFIYAGIMGRPFESSPPR